MTSDHRSIWHSLLEVEAILALGSLIIFGAGLAFVLFYVVPAENEKYVMLMLGALIGVVKDTFGRYFQATKGAQEQRKEAAEVARTLAETAAAVAPVAPAGKPGTADVDIQIREAPVTPAADDSGELRPEERIQP